MPIAELPCLARVSLHGERLAGARLAVGEHRGVVPGERGQYRVLGAALVHTLLAGVLVVDVIEGELVRVVEDAVGSDRPRSAPPRLEVLADGARAVPLVDVDACWSLPLATSRSERRSDADDNLEVLVRRSFVVAVIVPAVEGALLSTASPPLEPLMPRRAA